MANYYASARTSYVKVRDEVKFEEWASTVPSSRVVKETTAEGALYTIFFDTDDCNGIPWVRYREDEDGDFVDLEFDIYKEIQPHIAEGWAIIFEEAGDEKLRYIVGTAAVVTPTQIKATDLNSWTKRTLKRLGSPKTVSGMELRRKFNE